MTSAGDGATGGASDDRDAWEVPDEDVMRPVPRPERLDDLLAGFLVNRGWRSRMEAASVLTRWQRIVGTELAQRCEPVRLAGGQLVIRVESQAWATQISYLVPRIRERVAELLDGEEVEGVRLVVGPLQGMASEEG